MTLDSTNSRREIRQTPDGKEQHMIPVSRLILSDSHFAERSLHHFSLNIETVKTENGAQR